MLVVSSKPVIRTTSLQYNRRYTLKRKSKFFVFVVFRSLYSGWANHGIYKIRSSKCILTVIDKCSCVTCNPEPTRHFNIKFNQRYKKSIKSSISTKFLPPPSPTNYFCRERISAKLSTVNHSHINPKFFLLYDLNEYSNCHIQRTKTLFIFGIRRTVQKTEL